MHATLDFPIADNSSWTYVHGELFEITAYGGSSETSEEVSDLCAGSLWLDLDGYDGERAFISLGVSSDGVDEIFRNLESRDFEVSIEKLSEASQSGDGNSSYSYFPVGEGWMVV